MEPSSGSFFSFQQDVQFPIITSPEFTTTIWDFGLDHISDPANSTRNEELGIDSGENEKGEVIPKKLEEIEAEAGTAANQEVKKKILHRDVERQRRQEMATLYDSLHSVLPLQHIKGKRSTSDQLDEATKYIRSKQNNIRELGMKRDNLKRSRKYEFLDSEKGSSIVVRVQLSSVGVDVLVGGDLMAEGVIDDLPLSRILQLLLEEGLVVISCNFTKFDGKLHYMIQSEVLDRPGVDLQMLQRKLTCMIKSAYSS